MKFDLVVVTAANRAQARGYRAFLRGRKGFLVVPDPGDRRVGSLGATVNVLRKLIRSSGSELDLTRQRVLICHSGGDAKRTPAYAAQGKAFVPMADGRPMLDHIIDEMERYSKRRGVTVCCGDVVPYLDARSVEFAPVGVTGVAYPDGPWQAQRHGVYVGAGVGANLAANGLFTVADFMQKPQVKRGKFLIDTGILHIDWSTALRMAKLPIAGDIYEEFPKLLLEGFAKFFVSVVPQCTFFHIGSSRELLKLLGRKGRAPQERGRVLVDSVAAPIVRLAGDNIVTNVPEAYGPIELAKGECLTSLPLGKDSWYHLKYRIENTFKEDGLWEAHQLGVKMREVDHARLLKLKLEAK